MNPIIKIHDIIITKNVFTGITEYLNIPVNAIGYVIKVTTSITAIKYYHIIFPVFGKFVLIESEFDLFQKDFLEYYNTSIMSYYINHMPDGTQLPSKGKHKKLITVTGAMLYYRPQTLNDFQEDLVAIVENDHADAALYVDSPHVLQTVLNAIKAGDIRIIRWMKIPGAKYLSGYSLQQADLNNKNNSVSKITEFFKDLLCTMKQ